MTRQEIEAKAQSLLDKHSGLAGNTNFIAAMVEMYEAAPDIDRVKYLESIMLEIFIHCESMMAGAPHEPELKAIYKKSWEALLPTAGQPAPVKKVAYAERYPGGTRIREVVCDKPDACTHPECGCMYGVGKEQSSSKPQ